MNDTLDEERKNRTDCFWWFSHRWTKWEDANDEPVEVRFMGRLTGGFFVQRRRCETCNKLQLRRVGI